MADKQKDISAPENAVAEAARFGTGGHKAMLDVNLSFRTEIPLDEKGAAAFVDALTTLLKTTLSRAPGEVTINTSTKE